MKTTRVADVCQQSTMGGLLLHKDLPAQEAIARFAADDTLHGIFLVDDDERLVGVISNQDLLDWARLQFDLLPSDFPLPVGKVRRLLSAERIGDLAVPDSRKMAVRLHDTLSEALQTMAEHDLEDIAVLDETGRVINDLRLSEVLTFALRSRPPE